jgi:hypothetical protein
MAIIVVKEYEKGDEKHTARGSQTTSVPKVPRLYFVNE